MITAIIVAAGQSTRMGGSQNKLLQLLAGKPLMVHCWRELDRSALIQEIIWVTGESVAAEIPRLARQFGFRKSYRVVPGGAERQDSVWNGLQAIHHQTQIVLIHDAARPCLSSPLIEKTVAAARLEGAAVTAQRFTDTVKESDDGRLISRHLDRSKLWAVQTPQTFRVEILQRALEAVRASGKVITDDTAACEMIGQPVALVESVQPNPKLTRPEDLPYLEFLLSRQPWDAR